MANQDSWSNERRNFGGGYGGTDGDRSRPDERDDIDGQASGYNRYDRRDDYRYGGGASAGYGYGENRSYGAAEYQNADRDYGRGYGRQNTEGQRGYGAYGGRTSGQRFGGEAYGDTDYGFGGYGECAGYGQGGYGQGRGGYASSGGYEQGGYGRGYGQGGYGPTRSAHSDYGRSAAQGYGYDERFSQGRDYQGGDYRRAQEPRGWFDKTTDEVSSWFGDDEAARRRRQDEIRAGHHRGRGPSDYTRSDERIREDVNDRLTDDPHIDATSIQVQIKSGEITLSGTVKSRNDKRHAEDLAESVSGVKHVQNNLRVHDTNYDAQLSQSGTTTGSTASSSSVTGATGATGAARTN